MIALEGKTVFHKAWYLLRTYILTLKRFDLFLQGTLLILILLEHNVYLLLSRDAATGHNHALIHDWVLMGASGVEFFLGAAVAWWGRSRRHLALSSWLTVTAAAGLIVLAFPYAEPSPTIVSLCGGSPIEGYSTLTTVVDSNATPRTVMLIITAVLCTLTKISVWAHGLTYLDDHDPQNGPYFYGILISIRLSLGLSGKTWLQPGSLREDWWEAHISLCMLTLMFAFLFTLFPRRMNTPAMAEVDDTVYGWTFMESLSRVLRNKALVLQTGALALLNTGLFCFVHYDLAYAQARFQSDPLRQDPRSTSIIGAIFRSVTVIFFVMIFRVRFSARRSEGVKAGTAARVGGVVAVFAAAFFCALTVLGCDAGHVAGLHGTHYQQPACSGNCGCSSDTYGFSPVCALDTRTTYFSPCHAGCHQYEDLNGFLLFNNCTCGTGTLRAVRGSCQLPSCRTLYSLFHVFFTIVLAVTASSLLMQGMAVLRSVRRYDKPIAMGTTFAITTLIAHVGGHLIYMVISHLTCAYESGGACLYHTPTIWTMGAVSTVLSLLSAVVSLSASRVAVPQEPTTEL